MNYRSMLLAAAQTLGLFIAGFLIPVLGQALVLFTPVPLIVAYVRDGRAEGLTALFATAGIVAVLLGWHIAAILLFSFGLMAVGTAEGMQRRLRPERIAVLGGLLPIAAAGSVLAYYLAHTGKNPVTILEGHLRGSITEAAKLYAGLGLTEMASAVTSVSDTFVHYLVRLVPGIAVATSLLQAACCFGLARAIIIRGTGAASVPSSQPSLAAWHAPDAWVWGLIAVLALMMIPNEASRLTGLNCAIVFSVVYLVQGIAIVEHVLRKARIQAIARGLIHALILALPTIVFVIALGVVDIWADFRKVRRAVQQP
jgi:uncharacterized protein YybS (DUF2232 family)